jgi:hypothetical protein
MVSVAVAARVPVMVACGLMEQVGAAGPPEGPPLTEHWSATVPVKAPFGVIVMVAFALAPTAMDSGEALSEKFAAPGASWAGVERLPP